MSVLQPLTLLSWKSVVTPPATIASENSQPPLPPFHPKRCSLGFVPVFGRHSTIGTSTVARQMAERPNLLGHDPPIDSSAHWFTTSALVPYTPHHGRLYSQSPAMNTRLRDAVGWIWPFIDTSQRILNRGDPRNTTTHGSHFWPPDFPHQRSLSAKRGHLSERSGARTPYGYRWCC